MSPSLTRDYPEGGHFCLQPREVWADLQQCAPHTYTECPALPSHPTSFSGGLTSKSNRQGGLRTAAGGRGWGAWVRPGGKGASDKGTLCCANFFQDVKAVTIDNPDLGGHQGQAGSLASNPGQHFNKHRKKALTCPPPPNTNLQTEPNWRERRTEGDLGFRAEGGHEAWQVWH